MSILNKIKKYYMKKKGYHIFILLLALALLPPLSLVLRAFVPKQRVVRKDNLKEFLSVRSPIVLSERVVSFTAQRPGTNRQQEIPAELPDKTTFSGTYVPSVLSDSSDSTLTFRVAADPSNIPLNSTIKYGINGDGHYADLSEINFSDTNSLLNNTYDN